MMAKGLPEQALKGGTMNEEQTGSLSVREAGKKGGDVTAARHGRAHYQRIGVLGGARLRLLLEAGKEAEAREKKAP